MTTALDVLRANRHPLQAEAIADRMGVEIEEAYADLVSAEARRLVRVVIDYPAGSTMPRKQWEAM